MPDHLSKSLSLSRKSAERVALYRRILASGYEMSPCSRCVSLGLSCVVSAESRRCASCVQAGRACNVVPFSASALERLNVEEERLILLKEETLSRLLRLEQQQKLLRKRGAEMLRRGLESLDELEEIERREEEEKRSSEAAAAVVPSTAAFVPPGAAAAAESSAAAPNSESCSSFPSLTSLRTYADLVELDSELPNFELPLDFVWSPVDFAVGPALFGLGSPAQGVSGDTGQSSFGSS